MTKQYYAVQRTGEKSNELTHWKYVRKERDKNGKWRYYYDSKPSLNIVKDALGYDEKQAYEEMESMLWDGDSKDMDEDTVRAARDAAYNDYYDTPIYLIEKTGKKVQKLGEVFVDGLKEIKYNTMVEWSRDDYNVWKHQ